MNSIENIVFERKLNKEIDYIIDHEEELNRERIKHEREKLAPVNTTAGHTQKELPSPIKPLRRTESELFREECKFVLQAV